VVLTVLTGIALASITGMDAEGFRNLAIIFLVIDLTSFALSMKMIPGGFSQAKQAICHMGRITTKKGAKNTRALFFFIIYGCFEAALVMMLGNIIAVYGATINFLLWIRPVAYIASVFGMLTCVVPIDMTYNGHMGSALILFICTNTIVNYLLGFLVVLAKLTALSLVIWIIMDIVCLLYIIGFIIDYRYAPTFQKLWLVFTNFAVVILIDTYAQFVF